MKKKHILGGVLMVCLSASCMHHASHDHDHEHEHEGEKVEAAHEHHSDEIVLTPEKAEAAGVEVETVQPAPFRRSILTHGQILAAQGDEATVVAGVSGIVTFTHNIAEGVQVAKGAELMSISARNVQDGDPVTRARVAYETAQKEYERAQKLVADRIVSQKDFEAVREKYENARIAYEALSPDKKGKGVAVLAPMGGYVKTCLVKEGDYVTVGQPLMSITQTRRLRLRADLSERYYPQLSSISSANFKTCYNDRVFELDKMDGRLLTYGKSLGDASFYIPVTFEFNNQGNILPGSFVEVYLLSNEIPDVISIPQSALTEEQGLYFVYVRMDAECYRKQEVKLGTTNGKRVEILSGLKSGDIVVTKGAIHVKLASASNAIPGHTHNH